MLGQVHITPLHRDRSFPRSAWECLFGRTASRCVTRSVTGCIPTQSVGAIICGTCKVLKLGGDVEMDHNGGITEEDEAEGYILSCCSVPKGDVRIEF